MAGQVRAHLAVEHLISRNVVQLHSEKVIPGDGIKREVESVASCQQSFQSCRLSMKTRLQAKNRLYEKQEYNLFFCRILTLTQEFCVIKYFTVVSVCETVLAAILMSDNSHFTSLNLTRCIKYSAGSSNQLIAIICKEV